LTDYISWKSINRLLALGEAQWEPNRWRCTVLNIQNFCWTNLKMMRQRRYEKTGAQKNEETEYKERRYNCTILCVESMAWFWMGRIVYMKFHPMIPCPCEKIAEICAEMFMRTHHKTVTGNKQKKYTPWSEFFIFCQNTNTKVSSQNAMCVVVLLS
jgi:hypothetical protein